MAEREPVDSFFADALKHVRGNHGDLSVAMIVTEVRMRAGEVSMGAAQDLSYVRFDASQIINIFFLVFQ